MLTTGKQCVPAKHRHRKAKRMGWDGMGWDGMGWDGMGWDGHIHTGRTWKKGVR